MVIERDQTRQIVLQKALKKVLSSLGDSIMMTIDWHLKRNGIFLETTNLDIHEVAKVIEEIIGDGVDAILNLVYLALVSDVGTDRTLQFMPQSQSDKSNSMRPLDRIDHLLAAGGAP